MKLFVCMTPLQTLIANQIIEIENLNRADCILLYLSLSDNEINRAYYKRLSEKMFYSEYIISGRSLKTVFRLRRLLRNKKYDAYVSSIEATLVHYILSFLNLGKLTTFDDGTANIMPKSSYFLGVKRKFLRNITLKILNFLLGNRYSLAKLKQRTTKHYSIYQGYQNAVANPEYITLFKSNQREMNGKVIDVFLGTVYNEATVSKENAKLLSERVNAFLSTLSNYIYIPHPREEDEYILQKHYISSSSNNLVAEEYVIDLLKKYETVNLYGFGSSAQFNLLGMDGVNIYPISSKYMKDIIYDTLNMLSYKSLPIIRLD